MGGERRNNSSSWLRKTNLRNVEAILRDYGNVLGANHPLMALATQVWNDPYDADASELLHLNLQRLGMLRESCGDPFLSNCPPRSQELTAEDCLLVGNLATGDPMVLPVSRLASGTIISGPTGSGKTTMAELMVSQMVSGTPRSSVIVLDCKGTWDRLLSVPTLQADTTVIPYRDLRMSMFQPPPGCDTSLYVLRVVAALASAFGLWSAQKLLLSVVQSLHQKLPRHRWPSLTTVIQAVEAVRIPRGGRTAGYRDSVLWTLLDVRDHYGSVFEVVQSDMLFEMFRQPGLYIVKVEGLPPTMQVLLTTILQRFAFAYRGARHCRADYPILFVLEDSTSLLAPQRDRETPGGVSITAQDLQVSRERGVSIIAITHGVSALSPSIRENLENTIVCGTRDEEPRVLQRLLNIGREQAEHLQVMPRGQAVARIPSVWPHTVMASYPPLPDLPAPSDEQLARSKDRFMFRVTYVEDLALPPAVVTAGDPSQPSSPPDNLREEEIHLLTSAVRLPPRPAVELYDATPLSRTRAAKVLKGLVHQGYLEESKWATGSRGGAMKVVSPTAEGLRSLRARSVHVPQVPKNTSWKHYGMCVALQELASAGFIAELEVDLGAVRMDVAWLKDGNPVRFFQVGFTSPDREVDSVRQAMQVPSIQACGISLVVENKRFQDRIEKLLGKTDLGVLAGKVDFLFAGQVLKQLSQRKGGS
jgi:hypothetical protein